MTPRSERVTAVFGRLQAGASERRGARRRAAIPPIPIALA
jgi:hypothetical protein